MLHGREDVRHQLNQVFDALSMLNHKVSQFDNQGISTSTYEQQVRREREELYRVLYGLNIRKVDWGYGAPFQYSKVRKQKSDTTKNFSNSISVVNWTIALKTFTHPKFVCLITIFRMIFTWKKDTLGSYSVYTCKTC